MPSRPAIATKAEVKRIVEGFSDAGITVGMMVTKDGYWFAPIDKMDVAPSDNALDRFKAKRDARKAKA